MKESIKLLLVGGAIATAIAGYGKMKFRRGFKQGVKVADLSNALMSEDASLETRGETIETKMVAETEAE